jgi:hypothetical protein
VEDGGVNHVMMMVTLFDDEDDDDEEDDDDICIPRTFPARDRHQHSILFNRKFSSTRVTLRSFLRPSRILASRAAAQGGPLATN